MTKVKVPKIRIEKIDYVNFTIEDLKFDPFWMDLLEVKEKRKFK